MQRIILNSLNDQARINIAYLYSRKIKDFKTREEADIYINTLLIIAKEISEQNNKLYISQDHLAKAMVKLENNK